MGRIAGVRPLLAAAVVALGACAGPAPRAPETSPPATRPGGYYLDDGPGANPPADLDAVPDASPRLEPVRAANTRAYQVMGRTYVPLAALAPYSEEGIASWYGRRYHGQPAASGEIYDMYAMTAAHPTLPIPSYARVSRVDDGRAVVVRINDRGPFRSDRIIDLSYTAAYKLDMLATGSVRVRVDLLLPEHYDGGVPLQAEASLAQRNPTGAAGSAPQPGVYLQLGAFSVSDNAESFLRRMRAELPILDGLATIVPGDGLYRVHAGPYASRTRAQQVASDIERVLDLKPILVTR
jgi:rare lipoprotein A